MNIVRFQLGSKSHFGVLNETTIDIYDGNPYAEPGKDVFKPSGNKTTVEKVRLLAPCLPSKLICLGLNYRPHAVEFNQKLPELPLLFLKPSTAVIGPGEAINLPANPERVDYEGELGVVIGKKAKNVAESDYADYVLGYTCFNDVTDRIAQMLDGQWTRGKGYDTFAPIGPCIVTDISPTNLILQTKVNGEIKQTGNTADLIFGIPRLINFISSIMTLLPGDVIATGTPDGVGPLKAGDTVEIFIEGIGTLRNPVIQG
jgi:2-keto-4-pentenoate hydratase/2-oxohepta-3-ene-1,7-dioic acid hydratase in catechol pathway